MPRLCAGARPNRHRSHASGSGIGQLRIEKFGGDKYETGRAMAQLERDRHAQLLADAKRMLADLEKINPGTITSVVVPGSLVKTSRGTFFLAISAGKIPLDGADYFAVSVALLIGKRVGETVVFNRMEYEVRGVV